jgi:hypothetical protein
MEPTLYQGSCHCGAVRFAVTAELSNVSRCNCSVCTKTAITGKIVAPTAFELIAGEDALATYEWGGKISRRYFCRTCGVHCFARGHLAELGGDYVSVNVSCLDGVELATIPVVYWDGRHNNWQAGPRPAPWPILARA